MKLQTTTGETFLVDRADAAAVLEAGFRYRHPAGYVQRGGNFSGQTKLLHRWLMGLEKGNPLVVDHLNGDRMDFRRANLEVVTAAENTRRALAKVTK